MLHRLSVSAMMLLVFINIQCRTLLTFLSRVRRYDFHLKDAKSKKIFLASFRRKGLDKRFPILQSTSTSVAEMSTIMLRRPRKTIIQWPSSRGPSTLLSAVLLLNPQRLNPITTLSQIWPHAWDTLRPIHLLAGRQP